MQFDSNGKQIKIYCPLESSLMSFRTLRALYDMHILETNRVVRLCFNQFATEVDQKHNGYI